MPTIEIPRHLWAERLNEFSAVHEGWLVSLDVPSEFGPQQQFKNLPLIGVSADRCDHDGTITVSVARSTREHFSHTIPEVSRIYLQSCDNGADSALLVESAGAVTTRLGFRAAALPETVDGIVAPP